MSPHRLPWQQGTLGPRQIIQSWQARTVQLDGFMTDYEQETSSVVPIRFTPTGPEGLWNGPHTKQVSLVCEGIRHRGPSSHSPPLAPQFIKCVLDGSKPIVMS